MSEQTHMDCSSAGPPADFTPPLKALWWIKKGDWQLGPEWEKAHAICQNAEGEKAHDWVHALCHLIEGDQENAAYWFARAGKLFDNNDPVAVWEEIVAALR
ncbi:MAG: hypothetical protein AAGA50_19040 [Pseudomonadota bacterium]